MTIPFPSVASFPAKKYQVIYADPPWTHTSWGNGNRRPELHYPVMTLEEIKNLPVTNLTNKDAFLFLWITPPHLTEGLQVIQSWGFRYITVAFTWVKTNRKSEGWHWGCGSYTRANAELCLLGKRGHPKTISHSVHSVIATPIEEHSRKPESARQRIVQLCGDVPRIELFARSTAPGWDSWGNEVPRIASSPVSHVEL
jgi:N6-adenosine-specific RNA methylase IME4